MHSALFVVKTPDQYKDWDDFEGKIKSKLKPAGSDPKRGEAWTQLAENVWLLDLTKSAAPMGWLVGFCEAHGFSYGILPFDKKPEWLPNNFSV